MTSPKKSTHRLSMRCTGFQLEVEGDGELVRGVLRALGAAAAGGAAPQLPQDSDDLADRLRRTQDES